MVPVTPTYAEFEPVTWVCHFCKTYFVDDEAADRNDKKNPHLRMNIHPVGNADALVK